MGTNRRKPRRKRWFLLLLFAVLALMFIRSEWLGRLIYPIQYQDEIRQSAERYKIDPLLIAAVIRVESNYRPTVVSPKGAIGIMQLMPDTANWILKQDDFEGATAEEAGEKPEVGIRLGSWYLSQLLDQFDGNVAKSLAAYNAGPGKVKQWVNGQRWDGKESSLKDIPYGETRRYVQRVLHYRNKYGQVYKEGL